MGRALHTQNQCARYLAELSSMRGQGSPEDWRQGGVGAAVMRALRESHRPAEVTRHILDNDKWRPEAARVREVVDEIATRTSSMAAGARKACEQCHWSGWRMGWAHRRVNGKERVREWIAPCGDCAEGEYIAGARTRSEPPMPAHETSTQIASILWAEYTVPELGQEDGLLAWWMQSAEQQYQIPPQVGALAAPASSPGRVYSWQKARP